MGRLLCRLGLHDYLFAIQQGGTYWTRRTYTCARKGCSARRVEWSE